MNLNRSLSARLAFYKKRMPVHGKTLAEAIKNAANPAYASKGPCPSYASHEDMERGYPIKGWYGFPGVPIAHNQWPRPHDFNGVFGFRCVAAGGFLKSYDYDRTNRDAYGYFMDFDGFQTVYPLVFRLNGNRGFITGRYESDSGEVYITPQRYDDELEAFRAAHYDCRTYAEECREYYAKDRAECEIEELSGEIAETRKYILRVIAEAKANCAALENMPVIKDAIRADISRALRERSKAFERIAALKDDFWLAVER